MPFSFSSIARWAYAFPVLYVALAQDALSLVHQLGEAARALVLDPVADHVDEIVR